ncbi:unnamed protein product [Durusdinium trenchii]|uniref:Uncharacterized protein n=1 Tax=Durusdinium trenchii TaxID=1381693 RepID=A0ABP0JP21_9DINO
MAVVLSPLGPGVSVGKLPILSSGESVGKVQEQTRVYCESGFVGLAIDDAACPGREADIKPDLHWLLVTKSDGSFELQPVSAWYTFDRPTPDLEENDEGPGHEIEKSARNLAKNFLHSHMGEEGIKRDAQLRRQLERRWENMLERRAIRTGNWMDSSGKIRMQIQSDFRFSGDGVIPEVLNMLKSIKGVDTMQCLKELEALERMPWHKKAQLHHDVRRHPEQFQEAVAALDLNALDVNDGSFLSGVASNDTRRAEALQRKARQKKAKARKQVEDVEEVPETANTLKQLKSAKGEGLWDFEDAEEFSDDEQEEEDRNDRAEDTDTRVLAPEEIWESESEDDGGILSKQGQEMEELLKKHNRPGDADNASEDDEAVSEAPKAKAAKAKAKAVRGKTKMKGGEAAGDKVTETNATFQKAEVLAQQRPELVVPISATKEPPAGDESSNATSVRTDSRTTRADQTESKAVQKVQDTDDLRLKAITLLQKKGGSSYLGIVSAALGLKSLDTTFGQKALAVLKEVAEYEKMPGEARVAVLLKVEHWGHVAKGPAAPPEMAGKRRPWCYVDPSGNAVKDRASAQQVMTHSQEFYRTRLFTNVNASCWLPASKAPLQADFETDWEQISISA